MAMRRAEGWEPGRKEGDAACLGSDRRSTENRRREVLEGAGGQRQTRQGLSGQE